MTDTETPVANTVTVSVDIEVPAPAGGGVWATVALSFQVQILPAPPPISGYRIVDEFSQLENTSCKGGDPNTYVAYARQQIEANDQAMYNELINNRQIDIVLVTKQHPDAIRQARAPSDIVFGWSETKLSANSRLILNTKVGSVTFPPSGRYRDCPNDAAFLLKISSGEYQLLADFVGVGNYESNVPQGTKDIVDKISAANPSMRAILVSICENGPESELERLQLENKLVYTPSEAQLAEMIQLPLKASIYLVVDNLCDVSNYCEASASSNDVFSDIDRKQVLRDWYNNASSSTIQNNGTLQDARRRQYTRTLAHEMGHIYYAIQNKIERYKWDLLRDAFPVFVGDTCYPYRVQQHPPSGYCSRAHGHENLNGDGFFSCEKGESYPSPPPTINVN